MDSEQMKVYINGIGCISPQPTFGEPGLPAQAVVHAGPLMKCIEPIHKEYVNPMVIRRLSRIIRNGLTSAVISLKNAGVEVPGAIITGTGLGCVEDTEKFLTTMIDNQETLLNPTHFIQSTYNTISSQIAILLKCFNYNMTYVHRGFSFESALLDGMLLLNDNESENVLVGGIDEMTESHFIITSHLGIWIKEAIGSDNLLKSGYHGSFAGEGSTFLVLAKEKKESTYAALTAVEFFYKPADTENITGRISAFLEKNGTSAGEIDLVIAGFNGDKNGDAIYENIYDQLFPDAPIAAFKHLCGEYHTATGFATWLAGNIIKHQKVPEYVMHKNGAPACVKRLLLYNHWQNANHSLILFESA